MVPIQFEASQRRMFSDTKPKTTPETGPSSSGSIDSNAKIASAEEAPSSQGGNNERKDGGAGGGGGGSKARGQGSSKPGSKMSTWKALLLAGLFGTGIVVYYDYEMERVVTDTKIESAGKPLIGGPFDLIEASTGKRKTSEDYYGQYILIYFGFSMCPDICPTELKKMGRALNLYHSMGNGPRVKPVFISIDPKRDTPERLAEYSKEFHPDMDYLTGTNEEIGKVAKAFRVYFSAPEGDEDDYLVDHSIFFYLMGKNGEFLEYFGKNMTAEEVSLKMKRTVTEDMVTENSK